MSGAVSNQDRVEARGGQADKGERVRVVRGRSSGPFVMVPLWVVLNASPKARALYEVLAAHRDWWDTNTRVQQVTQEDLARFIDAKQARTVRQYARELEQLGAIDVMRQTTDGGLNATNVYVIHDVPPDGFTLPRTLDEHYQRERKTAGQTDRRSSAPRSNQGNPDTRPAEESGKGDGFRVVAGRADRRSSAPRRAPQRPLVGRSSAPLPYIDGSSKKTPPYPPSHTGHASVPGGPQGEGGGPSKDEHAVVPSPRPAADDAATGVACELLVSLPGPVTPGERSVRELAPLVVEALAAGWSCEALSAHLAADLPDRVLSVRALLRHRLEDLPAPPRPDGRPVPPRCDDPHHDPLAPHDRLLYEPGQSPRRCQACHPAALTPGAAS